jgi:hypothetical protein
MISEIIHHRSPLIFGMAMDYAKFTAVLKGVGPQTSPSACGAKCSNHQRFRSTVHHNDRLRVAAGLCACRIGGLGDWEIKTRRRDTSRNATTGLSFL